MIFKTFDSKIDKWTSKIGVFGKSFNELGTAINEAFKSSIDNLDSFDENVGFWESLKNNLFSKPADKDWIKNSLGDIISKENIDSYIKELDLNSAKNKLKEIFDWEEDVKNNETTWEKFFDTCKGGNEYLIDLIKNTDDLSKLTGEDLVKANQQARASALAHNEAIKAQTFSAKAGKVALQTLAMAGNMIAMWAISKGIELAVKGIDKLVHATEYAEKEFKEAINSANSFSKAVTDIKKESTNMEQSVDSIIDRFAQLSQGVNSFNNKNVTLSTDEYEEFLNLSTQLSELFPSLTHNYDENGVAILGLSGSVDSITASIRALVEQQNELAKARIHENLEQYFNGTDDADGAWRALYGRKQAIEDINGELENLTHTYNNLINSDSRFNIGTFHSTHVKAEREKYLEYIKDIFGEDIANELGDVIEINNGLGISGEFANLVVDFSQLELSETQKNQIIKSYETFYDELSSQQQTAISEFNSQNSDFSYNAITWLEDLSFYEDSNPYLQTVIQSLVHNIDWSSYNPEDLDYNGIKRILQDHIITPFQTACEDSDTQQALNESLQGLFTLDVSDLSINEANTKINAYIKTIAEILGRTDLMQLKTELGFDFTDDLAYNYRNTIHDIAKQASGVSDVELRRENGKYSDYKEIYDRIDAFADEYSINTQDEIAAFNQAFEEAEYDIDKAFKLYLQNLTDDNSFTPTISSSVEQISRQLEPQFSKLGDAYSSIFSENGFHLDAADNPMLEDLRKSFAEIDEEIGVTFDTDKINEFFDVLENGTSTVEDIDKAADIAKDAFNDLATAYFYATDTLEHLNEETAQSIKQQLEQMGIANSEEVIDHYLTLAEAENSLIEIQNRLADAQRELAESGNTGEYMSAQRNIEAVYAQMEAFYNEKGATEELRAALFNLQLQQANLDINSINTTASCQQLINLAKYAGLSGEYMERLLDLQDLISLYHSTTNGNMQSAMQPQINAARQELEDLLNAPLDLTFDFPNGKSSDAGSGAGSAGKDAAQEYLDGFNKECDRLKFLRDNSIITEKEYLDQLRVLYEKYFKDKEEYLEEYVKYEREYLNGLKSLYENALSGITGLLDKQMEKIGEERDAKIDALEEEQDARSKALEQQKEQLDLRIEEIETQIEVKDAAIDAINDEIDAIKKANDERQRQIDLQKSLYNLERMQNQRTILQYSEDKGMHYVSDTSGIRDAKQSVDDAKTEIEIAGKEKQISLIEDEISLLESRKTLLEDQQTSIDRQIDALDEFYQKLIANTETYYSALINPIEQYKAQFASIAEIESDAAFGEQLNSLGYSANDILALSSSTLENFKSNYLGILSDIYAGNTQMLDSISMVSGFNGENLVGYLSQSQPYIDSLARLDLTSTQTAIDSANSGIFSFADGAVLATANITTMADTTTTLLEGDKKHAGIISSFATMASVLTDANNQIAGITSGMEELDGKTATIKINIETNGDTSLLGNAYASGSAPAGSAHLEGTALVSGNWAIQSNEQHALVGEEGFEIIVRNGRYFTVGDRGAELAHIQKGDIVFNHEQSKHLLRYGHISDRGKAYADGSVGGGRFLTSGGAVLRPLQTDSQLYDLMQKFDAYMKRLDGNFKQLVPASFHEYNRQMNELINHKTNNSVVNNRNMQPVVNNEINVTLPNVTNATSAETLLKDLQSLGTKKFQIDW